MTIMHAIKVLLIKVALLTEYSCKYNSLAGNVILIEALIDFQNAKVKQCVTFIANTVLSGVNVVIPDLAVFAHM